MRVGIVCYPSVGGSGILATELGHQLAVRGHEVHFITYEIPFRLRPEEEGIFFHQVEISPYDLFKYPDYALTLAVKIAKVCKACHLDVLHVHYAIPHATSGYLAKQLLGEEAPLLVTTLHGTDITLVGKDPSYADIVRFSIEQSDVVTTVSQSLRQQTIEWFGIEKEIEVIPNFFVPHPQNVSRSNEEKLLVHSSNFRSVKRVGDVIEIFRRVRERVPSRLALIGSGSEWEEMRGRVREYGLDDSVTFLGTQREIDRYLAMGDLFLLPSSHESFGLAALEAMAYGVPVIASSVGGLPELIEDGVSGYLAPLGDVEMMAERAIALLIDENLYEKMSRGAKERADSLFSAKAIVPKYEDVYRRAETLTCPSMVTPSSTLN